MTGRASFLSRVGSGVGSLLATIAGGLYLIVLYVFTVWLVVGSLSAIQIRDDAQAINKEITFADVERSYQRHQGLIRQIYGEVDQTLSEFNQDGGNIEWQIEEAMAELERATGWRLPMSTYEFEFSSEYLEFEKGCELGASSANGACHLVETFAQHFSERRQIQASFDFSQYNELYAEAERKVAELRAAEPLARFFDIYEFFNFMPLYNEFLKEPQQILVLQLTIVMGMLGSVITMTWSFIKKDSGFTFRRFLILPFVGAMSAFIIFVFIKAGQLTLTAGGSSDALNPFVLSFVGIISGLLSERAYARMAEVGGNFFKVDDDRSRYGVGLRAALEQSGMSEPELASYLKLSNEETAAVIDGKAAASPLHQQLVAACLRRTIRELFTDLPPEATVPAASAPPVAVGQPG